MTALAALSRTDRQRLLEPLAEHHRLADAAS
jgi:hypothetical protein